MQLIKIFGLAAVLLGSAVQAGKNGAYGYIFLYQDQTCSSNPMKRKHLEENDCEKGLPDFASYEFTVDSDKEHGIYTKDCDVFVYNNGKCSSEGKQSYGRIQAQDNHCIKTSFDMLTERSDKTERSAQLLCGDKKPLPRVYNSTTVQSTSTHTKRPTSTASVSYTTTYDNSIAIATVANTGSCNVNNTATVATCKSTKHRNNDITVSTITGHRVSTLTVTVETVSPSMSIETVSPSMSTTTVSPSQSTGVSSSYAHGIVVPVPVWETVTEVVNDWQTVTTIITMQSAAASQQ